MRSFPDHGCSDAASKPGRPRRVQGIPHQIAGAPIPPRPGSRTHWVGWPHLGEGRIGGQVIGDAITRLAIPSHRLRPVGASGGGAITRIEGQVISGSRTSASVISSHAHFKPLVTSVFPAGADLGAYRRWGNRGTGHWSAITQIEGQVNCTTRPHWVGWPLPGEGQIEGQAR